MREEKGQGRAWRTKMKIHVWCERMLESGGEEREVRMREGRGRIELERPR